MYLEYFGLVELPYRKTPDPRYLWYSAQHQEAKEKILAHISMSMGPILLRAAIGSGKTTLAKRIQDELQENAKYKVVFVNAPKLTTTNSFLRFVMEEFEVPTKRAYGKSLKSFERFLIEEYTQGRSLVLLVDEAQNMTRDMLLLIQHLFNFNTDTEFLIQVALFSQPEIERRLTRLTSLKSRLSLAKLKPFEEDGETEKMLRYRWEAAGGSKQSFPFPPDVIAEIHRLSQGVPRTIVKLAHETLMKTAVDGNSVANKAAVVTASQEEEITGE